MKRIRVEKNWNVVVTVERGSGDNHRFQIRRRVISDQGGQPSPWETMVPLTEIANGAANKKAYIFDGYLQVTEWEIDPEYYYENLNHNKKWHSSYLKLERPHDGSKTIELVYEDHNRGDDYFDLLWLDLIEKIPLSQYLSSSHAVFSGICSIYLNGSSHSDIQT